MKKPFVALLVGLAVSTATAESFTEKFTNTIGILEKASEGVVNLVENGQIFNESWYEEVSNRGWILNNEGKKALQNIILTLPCGWPEYGIPPLAPYTNEELIINFKKKLIDTLTKLIRFRVDGLDVMLINKLKISYTFGKKVKYNITLPKLILTGKIDTEILINLMLEYGISVRYDGEGNFEMILENINIDGSFKYKVPFLFGSVKIYDFISVVSLENVVSNITFTNTLNKLNQLLNDQIEDYLWRVVYYNQKQISELIEKTVVPFVNEKMKGRKIWYLIGKLAGSSKTCYPSAIPWE